VNVNGDPRPPATWRASGIRRVASGMRWTGVLLIVIGVLGGESRTLGVPIALIGCTWLWIAQLATAIDDRFNETLDKRR
jgi:hypothetical protein